MIKDFENVYMGLFDAYLDHDSMFNNLKSSYGLYLHNLAQCKTEKQQITLIISEVHKLVGLEKRLVGEL